PALVVELFPFAVQTKQAAARASQGQAHTGLRIFGVAVAVIGQRERQIGQRYTVAGLAKAGLFFKILVVHTDRSGVVPRTGLQEDVGGMNAVGLTFTQHIGDAHGRDIAIGLVVGERQAPAWRQGHGVGG